MAVGLVICHYVDCRNCIRLFARQLVGMVASNEAVRACNCTIVFTHTGEMVLSGRFSSEVIVPKKYSGRTEQFKALI